MSDEAKDRLHDEMARRLGKIFQGDSLDLAITNSEYMLSRGVGDGTNLELLKRAKELRDAEAAEEG